MSLQKSISLNSGVNVDYIRIERANIDLIHMIMDVSLALYVDSTSYWNGKDPVVRESYQFSIVSNDVTSGDTVAMVQGKVTGLSRFSGAQVVA